MSSEDAYAGGNQAAYGQREMQTSMDVIARSVEAIKAAYEVDYREDRKSRLTAEDIAAAIGHAKESVSSTENNYYINGERRTELTLSAENWENALEVATHDGKIEKNEFDAIQSYLADFKAEIDAAKATVETDWKTLISATQTPPTTTPEEESKPQTERQMLELGAMTKFVIDKTGRDMKSATAVAAQAWTTLVSTVGSPEKLGVSLSSQTADEAEASGDATFTAMVDWCKTTLGMDETAAIAEAKRLWAEMRAVATDPGDLDKVYLYKGKGGTSLVYQEYARKTWGEDAEKAVALLEGYYSDLDAAAKGGGTGGEHPNTVGDTGHGDVETPAESNSYLAHVVEQLQTIYTEYTELMASWATLFDENGVIELSPEMQAQLDEIDTRLKKALGEVEWYETDEYMQGKGALGLAAAGVDWDKNYEAAMKHALKLREHGKAGLNAEVEGLGTAAGAAYQDYLEAVGRAGKDSDEAAQALEAYNAAQSAYNDAVAALPEKLQQLEEEYKKNIAAISDGLLKTTGYQGTGKGRYVEVTAAERTGTAEVPESQMLYARGGRLSPYAAALPPVSGHYVNGIWVPNGEDGIYEYRTANGTAQAAEGDVRVLQGQMNMTQEQKQVADALAANYGSWEAFLSDLNDQDRAAMDYALAGSERDYWQEIMFNAFGIRPDASTYQWSGFNATDAQDTTLFRNVQAMLGTKPVSAQDSADYTNALLAEITAAYDEASRYNAAREAVQRLVDAGTFEGYDWSTINGGWTEDILADMAAEFEAKGEEIPANLGKGMESSADTVFTEADLLSNATGEELETGLEEAGEQGGAGMAQGLGAKLPDVRRKAHDLAMAARDEIEKALDIRSPSHVMEGLGQYTGEGFAIGIEDMVNRVRASVASMVDATTQPVAAYTGAANGGGQGGSYSTSSAVYVDKYYQNSAEDIGYIEAQLADMQRRQLQGFGHRG